MNTVYFYDKTKPYYEFSNFYEHAPFTVNGITWRTSEHFYQAMKYQHNEIFMHMIRNCDTPGKVFALANQRKSQFSSKWKVNKNIYGDLTVDQAIDESLKLGFSIRPDWNEIKDSVMLYVVREKFKQNMSLRNILVSTGNAHLVEDSPRDSYWGVGKNRDGQNKLGLILMQVRSELN